MNLLTMEGITKAYTDKILLDQADFSINTGEKIGIVGINGIGKSTLLKLIAGIEQAEQGKISMGNNIKLRYLPQHPEFCAEDTILSAVLRDNLTKDNEWEMTSQAKTLINRLGLPGYDDLVTHLSGGQKKRIALANTLLAPIDILSLDEPTNHLDHEMTEWLEGYLRGYSGAVVMVTHDRYFLDRIVNRITEIDQGQLYNYPGNYSGFVTLKAQRQDMELASERKRQSLLRTELEWLKRGARARSTKQKAHIDRITALQDRQGPAADQAVEIESVSSRMGKKTLEVSGISKAYDGCLLIKDYSYIFLRNDRIGIVGANGCGKSTLLKILCGVLEPDTGLVERGQTIRLGYFSQENEYMDESLRVIDYIKAVGEYIQTRDGTITASQMLERFLFDGTLQYSLIKKLSGGEKRRLYLLRILMEEPNLLVLDEPTNDLDIQTLTILEDYLDHFEGIVITVSHDRYFLDRVVRRIFAFTGEAGEIAQYEGGYSDYLAKREEQEQELKEAGKTKKEKQDTRVRQKKLKFTFYEEKEYEIIDEEIADLEERIERLNHEMEQCASDYNKLNEVMAKKEELDKQLEQKMDRWVYLNDLNDQITIENSKKIERTPYGKGDNDAI